MNFVFVLIFALIKFTIGGAFKFMKIKTKKMSKSDITSSYGETNLTCKFRLNQREIDAYEDAFYRIQEYNDILIRHIRQYISSNMSGKERAKYVSTIRKSCDLVSIARKDAVHYESSVYEFYKMCEFTYQAMHYILQFHTLSADEFFSFLIYIIVPRLVRTQKALNSIIVLLKGSFQLRFLPKKKKEVEENIRRKLLFDYCTRTLIQGVPDSLKSGYENYTVGDLLSLSSNLFVRSYLISTDKDKILSKKSYLMKPWLSKQFKNLLLFDAKFTGHICKMRMILSMFMEKYHKGIEGELLRREKIVEELDFINEVSKFVGKKQIKFV